MTPMWSVVDAQKSVADIHKDIMCIVEKAMSESCGKPLGTLWTEDSGTES